MTGVVPDFDEPDYGVDPDFDRGTAHLHPRALAFVAGGGFAGTLARYGLVVALRGSSTQWPMATFAANMLGAFVLGVLIEHLSRHGPDTGRRRDVRLLGGVGFCGGFTTYSSFAVETTAFLRRGLVGSAVGYAVATVVVGAALTTAGVALAAARHDRTTGR